MARADGDVTRMLVAAQSGDARAAEELLPLVYEELRRLAAHRLAGEQRQFTLQPTALVHEAWLKISGDEKRAWNGRQHFFAAAAEATRRILVDRARRRLAAKRGAGEVVLDADELEIPAPAPDEQLVAVSEAVEKFAREDVRKAELVKLRYFVGMTFEEASEALGIAVPTAKEWWAYSRAWLRVEITESSKDQASDFAGASTDGRFGLDLGAFASGDVGGPGLAGFGLDVGEAHAGGGIGDADEMLAGGALDLPAGELSLALQGLIAVVAVKFEFVGIHRSYRHKRNRPGKSMPIFSPYFLATDCA